jgi:hypothetical protein
MSAYDRARREGQMTCDRFTAEELRRAYHYDPCTGIFTRLEGRRAIDRNKTVGYVAPRKDGRRYVRLRVFGHFYAVGRLAWLYKTGEWPTRLIDHINCNSEDNRFSNLRLATRGENSANSRLASNNSSGMKGVYKKSTSYQAEITHNGKRIYLGSYLTKESAHAAYEKAAREYFGEYARPNG